MNAMGKHQHRTRHPTTPAALCALLLFTTLTACAGNPEPIGPDGIVGEHARVELEGGYAREGILRSLDSDTLALEMKGEPLPPIPLSPTARLEIQRGTKSNAGKGAGIGALVGGAGLAVAGGASCDGSGWFDPGPGACALAGGLTGAGTGALIGLIIGSFSESPQWVEVDRTR
ncbi:MAG: hypothetical protein ACODAA_00515 [Gemmatimonadota bacterium]